MKPVGDQIDNNLIKDNQNIGIQGGRTEQLLLQYYIEDRYKMKRPL